MHLSQPEYEQERRNAVVLLLIRDRTRNSMALHFRVWRLLYRGFEALVKNVDVDEAALAASVEGSAVGQRPLRSSGARSAPSRSLPRSARDKRRGLRGTSTAE